MDALKKKGLDQLKFVLHKLKFGLHSQTQVDRVLLVLAPFTLPTETDKALVLEKSKEWCHQVGQVFDCSQQQEALDILGLFVLNRFSFADFVSSIQI